MGVSFTPLLIISSKLILSLDMNGPLCKIEANESRNGINHAEFRQNESIDDIILSTVPWINSIRNIDV